MYVLIFTFGVRYLLRDLNGAISLTESKFPLLLLHAAVDFPYFFSSYRFIFRAVVTADFARDILVLLSLRVFLLSTSIVFMKTDSSISFLQL